MKKLLIGFIALASFSAFACPDSNLCVGDKVIDNSNDIGIVLQMFNNGKVKVRWDDSRYSDTITTADLLSKKINCFKSYCNGTRVVDHSNDTGKILMVFRNGKVKIDWDNNRYSNTITSVKTLGISYRCSGNLCVGDKVIDQWNDTGTVIEVFNNGKVKVDWDNSRYSNSIATMNSLGYDIGECYN